MITITDAAQAHFRQLLKKQKDKAMQLRIEAINPNSAYPECGVHFFKPDPAYSDDIPIGFDGFVMYVDTKSMPYLQNTYIDFKQDGLNGQLYVETPNLQAKREFDSKWPVNTKVQFILDTEINPQVAMHGGMVSLIEVTKGNVVILQFGGGCQGCGMIDVTLKQGVEKTLKAKIPEIAAVKDITDHAAGDNPYY